MGCHLKKTRSSDVKVDEVQAVLAPHQRPSNNRRNSARVGWVWLGRLNYLARLNGMSAPKHETLLTVNSAVS